MPGLVINFVKTPNRRNYVVLVLQHDCGTVGVRLYFGGKVECETMSAANRRVCWHCLPQPVHWYCLPQPVHWYCPVFFLLVWLLVGHGTCSSGLHFLFSYSKSVSGCGMMLLCDSMRVDEGRNG